MYKSKYFLMFIILSSLICLTACSSTPTKQTDNSTETQKSENANQSGITESAVADVAIISVVNGYGILYGNDDVTVTRGSQVASENGVVYFVNKADNYYLYSMAMDGSNKNCLVKDARVDDINVLGGYLYYTISNTSKYQMGIYRMKTDGTQKELLYKGYTHFMSVIDGNIYFNLVDFLNKDGYFCKIDINGKEFKQLYSIQKYGMKDGIEPMIKIYGDYGYMIHENTLYRLALDGGGITAVYSSSYLGDEFIPTADGIYIQTNVKKSGSLNYLYRICRIDSDGQNLKLIVDDHCDRFVIDGSKIIYCNDLDDYVSTATTAGVKSGQKIYIKEYFDKELNSNCIFREMYYTNGYAYRYKEVVSVSQVELVATKLQ